MVVEGVGDAAEIGQVDAAEVAVGGDLVDESGQPALRVEQRDVGDEALRRHRRREVAEPDRREQLAPRRRFAAEVEAAEREFELDVHLAVAHQHGNLAHHGEEHQAEVLGAVAEDAQAAVDAAVGVEQVHVRRVVEIDAHLEADAELARHLQDLAAGEIGQPARAQVDVEAEGGADRLHQVEVDGEQAVLEVQRHAGAVVRQPEGAAQRLRHALQGERRHVGFRRIEQRLGVVDHLAEVADRARESLRDLQQRADGGVDQRQDLVEQGVLVLQGRYQAVELLERMGEVLVAQIDEVVQGAQVGGQVLQYRDRRHRAEIGLQVAEAGQIDRNRSCEAVERRLKIRAHALVGRRGEPVLEREVERELVAEVRAGGKGPVGERRALGRRIDRIEHGLAVLERAVYVEQRQRSAVAGILHLEDDRAGAARVADHAAPGDELGHLPVVVQGLKLAHCRIGDDLLHGIGLADAVLQLAEGDLAARRAGRRLQVRGDFGAQAAAQRHVDADDSDQRVPRGAAAGQVQRERPAEAAVAHEEAVRERLRADRAAVDEIGVARGLARVRVVRVVRVGGVGEEAELERGERAVDRRDLDRGTGILRRSGRIRRRVGKA